MCKLVVVALVCSLWLSNVSVCLGGNLIPVHVTPQGADGVKPSFTMKNCCVLGFSISNRTQRASVSLQLLCPSSMFRESNGPFTEL